MSPKWHIQLDSDIHWNRPGQAIWRRLYKPSHWASVRLPCYLGLAGNHRTLSFYVCLVVDQAKHRKWEDDVFTLLPDCRRRGLRGLDSLSSDQEISQGERQPR